MAEGNKPVGKYRAGKATVTVWENEDKDGNKYNSFQVDKNYVKKDKDGKEEWKTTNSFSKHELQDLQLAINKALLQVDNQAEAKEEEK